MYDFEIVRQQFRDLRRRNPGYTRDISRFQKTAEAHIARYGQYMIMYRRTHRESYLALADQEIAAVNELLNQISKWELMSLLSRETTSDK